MSGFTAQLRDAGMSAQAASAKAALFENLIRELQHMRGAESDRPYAFFVPGRVEFLGKHTDYAGGPSIVCAIERGLCLVAAPRTDAQLHFLDVGRSSKIDFPLDATLNPSPGHWSNFPMTVARRMARDFPEMRAGADIAFTSDLPRASGMSSSSALITAVFFALAQVNSLWDTAVYRRAIPTSQDLAAYLAAIESGADFGGFSGAGGVGTHGGSEDHVAILCSCAGFLRQYSFCPIQFDREIRFRLDHAFVIAVSGVKADKTGEARNAYNHASATAREILHIWRLATGRNDASLAAALASVPTATEQIRQFLNGYHGDSFSPEQLLNRFEQFVEESAVLVPGAADALASLDLQRLGEIVDRSQFLAQTLLGNQVPETINLSRSARELGAIAASAFGAGFGGSVWALVSSDQAEEFRAEWAAQYHRRFPARAATSEFFIARPGPGLIQLR